VCAVLFVLFYSSFAFAGKAKIEVCHAPLGNVDNFHTIKISEKALAAHLAHGDLIGPCNEVCAVLCDDGNACTVDDTADCEQNGCPAELLPVDCSDGNLCTDDLCDPVSGCYNPVAVQCEPPDLCTSSTCDPFTGECAETPILCDEGEECNPDNGQCESIADPDVCPCFNEGDLLTLGEPISCDLLPAVDLAYFVGQTACSGEGCGESTLACFLVDDNFAGLTVDPINAAQNENCRALIAASCAP
jgi:hypothetical protein